ncbi:MAG: hypothetical protein QXE79_06670, partial [Candidatus Bathyarchaeia archaeon]
DSKLRNHSYENVKPMKPVESGIRINLKSRGEGGSLPRSESIQSKPRVEARPRRMNKLLHALSVEADTPASLWKTDALPL